MSDGDEPGPKDVQRHLRAIADALGRPIGAFYGDAEAEETQELLRAWHAIGDAEGRRRVLDLAQREAERSARGGLV